MVTQTAPTNPVTASESSLARFIQCRTPAARYEWMRRQGDLIDTIVLEAVAVYRAEVDARGGAPRYATRDGGPHVTYNVRLDNDLYNWLRTTALHARASINALVDAALMQAQAAPGGKAATPNA